MLAEKGAVRHLAADRHGTVDDCAGSHQRQALRANGESDIASRLWQIRDAFRWNGLNLASLDAQLGRYFGTDKGVLVLSTGAALGQLQAGDVIQRVDGKPVDTPRAVMDALRDKPADSTVTIDYLRDRKSGSTPLKVPKAVAFPPIPPIPPIPPMPPAPPHPPKAGAAPNAPAAAMWNQRQIVMIDKDGQV